MWQTLLPEVAQSFIGKDGKEIAPAAGLSWVRPVPWGFGKLLKWAHQKFGYDIYM
jgi:beta-glucosidase